MPCGQGLLRRVLGNRRLASIGCCHTPVLRTMDREAGKAKDTGEVGRRTTDPVGLEGAMGRGMHAGVKA